MENLYEILQCAPTASRDELRRAYTRLALQHHPDKTAQRRAAENSALSAPSENLNNGSSSVTKDKSSDSEFVKIDLAWKVLGNDDLRAEYDIKWQDRCLMQEHPVQDSIPFDDFDFDPSEEIYSYPCRCGSEFLFTDFDRQLLCDYVCCGTCSLTVKIIYG
ncbi:hypothetical protein EGW08_020611, partial [Elysia chlorotica]